MASAISIAYVGADFLANRSYNFGNGAAVRTTECIGLNSLLRRKCTLGFELLQFVEADGARRLSGSRARSEFSPSLAPSLLFALPRSSRRKFSVVVFTSTPTALRLHVRSSLSSSFVPPNRSRAGCSMAVVASLNSPS